MSTASLRREMTVRHTDVMAVTWLHSWCSGRTVHTCAKLLVRHPCVIAAAAHVSDGTGSPCSHVRGTTANGRTITTPALSAVMSIDGWIAGRLPRASRPLKHRHVTGAACPTSTASSRPVSTSHIC